jgi:hypothetical protein
VRVFENRLLRGVFGSKRAWNRRLLKTGVVSRTWSIMRAGRAAGAEVNRNAYRILVVKRGGKTLGEIMK